jgi:hypothetical protein
MAEARATKLSINRSAEQTQNHLDESARQSVPTNPHGAVLALQRSAGNHAVNHLLESGFSALPSTGAVLQRKCACGGAAGMSGECEECSQQQRLGLQTKLKINEPGDIYEQEADRIADQVIATPAHHAVSGASPRIQRFSGQSNGQMGAAPASVDQALASPGRPLEPALRQDMEQRFGHDFSRVRVHSGAVAEQSARDVNARAYTVGHDVVFGAGLFAPGTHEGRRLLAHELTHVVQQSGADGVRAGQSNDKHSLSGLSPNVPEVVHVAQQGAGNPVGPVRLQRQPAPPERICVPGLAPDDPACVEWAKRQEQLKQSEKKPGVPPFFGLNAAPDAFRGIVLFYNVTALPHTHYVDTSMLMHRGPYIIAPNLRRNPDGTSSIGYYIAFRKEPGLIGPSNWNEYAIGPDSIEQFLSNLNAYAASGATGYMFGPPAPNAIEGARFVNNIMAGEFREAFRAYGRSLYESVKDPGWWTQMLIASAGLFRGPAVAPRAPTPGVPVVPEAPIVPSAPPTLTIVSRGGGAPATSPVGRVGGVVYATEGSAALKVSPAPAPTAPPAPSPLRSVPPQPAAPAPAPAAPLAPTPPGPFIPPLVAATVTAVIAAGGPRTTPGVGPATQPQPVPQPKPTPRREDKREECMRTHPYALLCQEPIDLHEVVMNFLLEKGFDFTDILDIQCRGVGSFGPGAIDACVGAPGERWHCRVTARVRGSVQVGEVSVFGCLCCQEDGTTSFEWRGAHWSVNLSRRTGR